jgi:hypothetical protein
MNMIKLVALVGALILSAPAMSAGNGNSDSGDGGSVVVEKMIHANEAAMARYAEEFPAA